MMMYLMDIHIIYGKEEMLMCIIGHMNGDMHMLV